MTNQEHLKPQQLILSPAGAPKLVFSVRGLLEARPDLVCISIDIRNCYNEILRAACIEAFEAAEELRHLTQFFGTTLASPSALEAGGRGRGGSGYAGRDGGGLRGPGALHRHSQLRL